MIRGYEYGARTIVTASEYYPAEAVKYINSLDELSFKNVQTTTNAPEEHSNGQVAVLKTRGNLLPFLNEDWKDVFNR